MSQPYKSYGLGDALRTARQSRGYSQRDMAYLARMATSTIENMEADRVAPLYATVERYLEVLGYEIEFVQDPSFTPALYGDPVSREPITARGKQGQKFKYPRAQTNV